MRGTGERRKQRRYIVVGMEASVEGEACPILDISLSAVRVLRSSRTEFRGQQLEIVIRVKGRRSQTSREYRVTGRVIRSTELDVVFDYDPPTRQWEATLRAHDTFHHTLLREI
jgi:hypothetical protein